MAVTNADIKAFAPQFSAVANSVIDLWISWAAGAVDSSVFGVNADQATILWVCHNLQTTQGGNAGALGPETSRSVGDVSVAHSPAGLIIGQSAWMTTAYGVALKNLTRRYTAGPTVT